MEARRVCPRIWCSCRGTILTYDPDVLTKMSYNSSMDEHLFGNLYFEEGSSLVLTGNGLSLRTGRYN